MLGRITSGVKLINLNEGIKVASFAKVREKIEENAPAAEEDKQNHTEGEETSL